MFSSAGKKTKKLFQVLHSTLTRISCRFTEGEKLRNICESSSKQNDNVLVIPSWEAAKTKTKFIAFSYSK